MNEIALPVVLRHPSIGATSHQHGGAGAADTSLLRTMAEEQLCCRCLNMLLLACAALEVAEQLRYGEYNTSSVAAALQWHVQHSIQQSGTSTGAGQDNDNTASGKDSPHAGSEASDDGFTRGWLCDARAQEILKMLLQLAAFPLIASSCADTVNSWFAQNSHALAVHDMPDYSARDMGGPLILAIFDMMENMQSAIIACILSGIQMCTGAAESSRHHRVSTSSSSSSSLARARGTSAGAGDSEHGSAHARSDEREGASSAEIPEQFDEFHALLQAVLCSVCSSASPLSPRVLEVIVHSFPSMVALPVQCSVQKFLRALVPLCNRSANIFAVLHGYLQKRIQSNEYHAQMSAVRLLVPLLFAVPASVQLEVARTVTFVFTRPAVFCREVCILLIQHLQLVLPPAPDCETDAAEPREEMHLSERVVMHLRTAVDRYLASGFATRDDAAHSSSTSSASSTYTSATEDENIGFDSAWRIKATVTGLTVTSDVEHAVILLWMLDVTLSRRVASDELTSFASYITTDPSASIGVDGTFLHQRWCNIGIKRNPCSLLQNQSPYGTCGLFCSLRAAAFGQMQTQVLQAPTLRRRRRSSCLARAPTLRCPLSPSAC
jgi:hypothetical protein